MTSTFIFEFNSRVQWNLNCIENLRGKYDQSKEDLCNQKL